jgi:hypothetical protein
MAVLVGSNDLQLLATCPKRQKIAETLNRLFSAIYVFRIFQFIFLEIPGTSFVNEAVTRLICPKGAWDKPGTS